MYREFHVFVVSTLLVLSGCASAPDKSGGVGQPTNTPNTPNTPTTQIATAPTSTYAQCVKPAIDWMREQKVIYIEATADRYPDPVERARVSREWRDCSGNFLRLSSRIATLCDVNMVAPKGVSRFTIGGVNERPGKEQARTTRGIAKWYDEKGLFIPVYYDDTELTSAPPDLNRIRNMIRDGSVLWFSRGKPLKANGKQALFSETSGTRINHMGTVFEVARDEQGNVVSWKMYHGQNEKRNNEITSHTWVWPASLTSRGQKYPPGGYWSQRIVGFAEYIIPPPVAAP